MVGGIVCVGEDVKDRWSQMERGRHREEDRENQEKESGAMEGRAATADADGRRRELEAHVSALVIGGILGTVMLCACGGGSPGLLVLGVLDEDAKILSQLFEFL